MKMTNEPIKRLERLESRLAINTEVEDLSETDLELYGWDVIREIYQQYGLDHLKKMMNSPTLSEESKIIIVNFMEELK